MKLTDLGERKLINSILSILGDADIAVGPGDDCAAIEIGDEYLLISTDMVTQRTHLPRSITPYQIGWFIIAINLSDLAAKGGKPLGLVVSIGLPEDYEVEDLSKMTEGMNDCARTFQTRIIGGDLKSNPEVTLCGTAIGTVPKSHFMGRKGCSPGELVAVTGALGGAAAGYYSQEHSVSSVEYDDGLKQLFEPYPRVNEGQTLSKLGAVTCSMDISDGLASSVYQLSELNKVGFELEWEKVPVSNVAQKVSDSLKIPIQELALYFGGEYELIVTLKPDIATKAIEALQNQCNTDLTIIGKVISDQENKLVINGKPQNLENRGYEHFTQP